MLNPLPLFLAAWALSAPVFCAGAGPYIIHIESAGPRLTHVGLGFLNNFVYSDTSGLRYENPADFHPVSARANVSFGFDMHREPQGRFRRFQDFPFLRGRRSQGVIQVVLSDEWPKSTYPHTSSDPADSAAWEFTVRTCIESAVDRFGLENV